MAFEHLPRAERRRMQKFSRDMAALEPATMTEIHRSRWPPGLLAAGPDAAPLSVYRSRKFLAQFFDAPDFDGQTCVRLSVSRATLGADGRWEENITWEELMQVKRELGLGQWYAVEVYPPDDRIVNVANMRHLWMFEKPLAISF